MAVDNPRDFNRAYDQVGGDKQHLGEIREIAQTFGAGALWGQRPAQPPIMAVGGEHFDHLLNQAAQEQARDSTHVLSEREMRRLLQAAGNDMPVTLGANDRVQFGNDNRDILRISPEAGAVLRERQGVQQVQVLRTPLEMAQMRNELDGVAGSWERNTVLARNEARMSPEQLAARQQARGNLEVALQTGREVGQPDVQMARAAAVQSRANDPYVIREQQLAASGQVTPVVQPVQVAQAAPAVSAGRGNRWGGADATTLAALDAGQRTTQMAQAAPAHVAAPTQPNFGTMLHQANFSFGENKPTMSAQPETSLVEEKSAPVAKTAHHHHHHHHSGNSR